MHREISHIDEIFAPERNYTLYFFTGLMGLLIALDLWPRFVAWSNLSVLPTWSNTIFGWDFATIAAFLGGGRILYTSLAALTEGRLGADLAIAIATIAAILIGEPLVAAEVVFIGLVGECLESFTFERTQRAIRKIVEVCPRRCWLLRDGQEVRVRTSELQVGDVVVVKPGARVPVDGVVLDGRSAVDTSALTGESLPVDKGPGDKVLAGSLNQFGALTIHAQQVAEQTVIGRVMELTSNALKNKANIERTVDRMARYFLPLVLCLAAITFLGAMAYHTTTLFRGSGSEPLPWSQAIRLSVYPMLAVLVVACPCALVLATPAAIIAALGRLAGTGVLIKGGGALERLAGVSAFAFDKTGTLTEGRLSLGDTVALNDVTADELLRIAATAEQHSEHLIAQLILHEASNRQLVIEPILEFQAHPGAGVSATTAAGKIIVGNRRLLEERGIPLSDEVHALLERFDGLGQSVLLVACNERVLGIIGVVDQVRPEAHGVIEDLQSLGIGRIALLTGDRAAVANAIAGQLGINEVHAELLPEQKAEIVARMRQEVDSHSAPHKPGWLHRLVATQHGRVAMVGDGINDAPALAGADVGLAIGGVDVAADAGDVVFMGDPLRPLPLLVRLSRQTVHILRQNIVFFAFGVNFFGILLTAWLWPLIAPAAWYEQSPLAAVIYHQLGSLAVLLNSMRLLWFERATTNSTILRMKHSLQQADQWMERHLDIGEAIHWVEHHWRRTAAVLLLILLIAIGLSGINQINANEVGVVLRFGRPIADLGPGLYWRWPWPVENVIRIQPQQIRKVEIGYRTTSALAASQSLSWVSAHAGEGILRIPNESAMMTGDGNLVDLQATVHYRVSKPHVFLFEVNDPDAVIRGTAESILRELVAQRSFSNLLTTERGKVQEEALQILKQRLDTYGRTGMGVVVQSLSINDLHPPQDVVQSYYEVTRAMEYRDELMNEAQAQATRILADAAAKRSEIQNRSDAEFAERVHKAEASAETFRMLAATRSQLNMEQEWHCFVDALNEAIGGTHVNTRDRYVQKRQEQIALQQSLMDFRLFWNALSTALTGRDMILIDADRIPGRRQLLLFDPERFQIPVPFMTNPGGTSLPRTPIHDENGG